MQNEYTSEIQIRYFLDSYNKDTDDTQTYVSGILFMVRMSSLEFMDTDVYIYIHQGSYRFQKIEHNSHDGHVSW